MIVETQTQTVIPAIAEELFTIVQDMELAYVGGGGAGSVCM